MLSAVAAEDAADVAAKAEFEVEEVEVEAEGAANEDDENSEDAEAPGAKRCGTELRRDGAPLLECSSSRPGVTLSRRCGVPD